VALQGQWQCKRAWYSIVGFNVKDGLPEHIAAVTTTKLMLRSRLQAVQIIKMG